MKDKFIVRIPIDIENENGEYKEVKFKTRKEITEFLKISMNSLAAIINHDFKFTLPKYKYLKGIKIERVVEENNVPKEIIDPVEFRKQLIEKIS